ncbi:T9SS type B sorting domain-containing protein [Arenitalea sp.]|nr:T9SS type B sorting domain-containing protein [Algibacter sp.]MDA9069679.1 T9SS type B sorting domain-containing protein [Algibacter sp.]
MTFEVHAQLGFCTGNSGDPIITQDFDTGTSHIDLPFGTTNYDPVFGFPLDGQYTVLNGTFGNGFDWHETQDHTPGDTNGKCLIVNAAAAPGEFYTITINDLCPDTTYEFSAWVINLVEAGGFCGSGAIPINVRFEIDINGTIVSGNTGNIVETATPIWKEYGLVFNTGSETSVILRMINNGAGGCGNDLAIDDIEFKTCGDLTIVEDASANTNINICSNQTPYATILTAVPDNSVFSTHFYQWQESSDGIIWNDIVGETSQNISISGVISTMFYRSKVSESMTTVNEPLCNTLSDIYQVTVNSLPSAPTTECWETANINTTTCLWEVTGTQPVQPTIDCWETAIFNDTTCLWEVTGEQPVKPTTECWETATFNDATCLWEVTGVQPVQPNTDCWEIAIFNDTTCLWEVTGVQPVQPNTDCWEIAIFNDTTCLWEVTGLQPVQPNTDCWETAIFNDTTCLWEVTGVQPVQPTTECWETATLNDTTCLWEVTGVQPVQPNSECWEIITFNNTTCLWEVTGVQPVQPNTDCWETAIFNDTTCLWEVTGAQPVKPTTECWETATFNDTTCLWGLTGVKPIQPTTACWETATFNDTTCLWGLTGEQPAEPPLVDCWDNYVFNTTTCVWDNTGSQPIQPIIDSVVSNGNDIIISTTNTGDFIYSLDGNIFQDNNTFYNVEGALYTVYVKEINCNNIASIQHLHFIIPKFFTPNNDGFNDMFTLTGIEFFSSSEVSIFNRYGKLLKYSRNNPFSWNGTFNNQKLPTNDYWYIIIIDGQKFTGYFTLKR